MMCLFHKWSRWEQYKAKQPAVTLHGGWMLAPVIEHRQRRKCEKCGYMQDKLIHCAAMRKAIVLAAAQIGRAKT